MTQPPAPEQPPYVQGGPVSPPGPYPPQRYAPISSVPQYVVATKPPTSGTAVASMIFGILGLVAGCCTFGVFSILAVVCGHVALREIRGTGKSGDGMAKAGLIMGYILVVPMIVLSVQVVLGAGIDAMDGSTP